MRQVDFTPQWYRDVQTEQRSSSYRVVGLLATLGLMVVCSFLAESDSNAAMAELNLLRESYHAQTGLVDRLDQLDQQHAATARQYDMLADTGGGITVSDVFRELSHLMPEALSIRHVDFKKASRIPIDPQELSNAPVEMEPPPDTTTLEISGLSQKGRDIGILVSQMSRSALFFDVQLRYERSREVYGANVVEFVIDCKMPSFE